MAEFSWSHGSHNQEAERDAGHMTSTFRKQRRDESMAELSWSHDIHIGKQRGMNAEAQAPPNHVHSPRSQTGDGATHYGKVFLPQPNQDGMPPNPSTRGFQILSR